MNPSRVQARKLVLVSMGGLLLIAAYRQAKGEDTGSVYKRLWGVGVLSVMLSVLADFAPTIAGPFALLTLLGSFSAGGDKAIQNLLGALGKPAPAAKPAGR